MNKKHFILVWALILTLVLGACGNGGAQTSQSAGGASSQTGQAPAGESVHITVGHAGAETTMMHLGMVEFKRQVEELSGGAMTVEIFANGQLGGDTQLQEAVQNGDLNMAACNTAVFTVFEPRLSVFSTPFAFNNSQHAYAVLDSDFGQKMLDMMSEHGFKALGYYESFSYRVLTSNSKVQTPDDLKGLKVRVMQSSAQIALWEALGGSPTSIPFNELYTALQQNTVDAQENPLELIVSSRFYEVQKYVTLTNHVFAVGMATMNQDFYNALSAEQQEIVGKAMDAAIDYQRTQAVENYDSYVKILEDAGVEMIQLTDAEMSLFREKGQAAYSVIADEVGQDLLDEFLEAVESAA